MDLGTVPAWQMTRWVTAAATLAVLAVTLLLYWPGLQGPFVLDDYPNILEAYVADPGLSSIIYTVTHNGSGLLGRSVAVLTFVLTGLQYGLEPWGYKFHNLLIHLCCGLLLFRLLFLLLVRTGVDLHGRRPLIVAGVVSGIWLAHPLLISTVLYAVQRMTQLAALFSLLALLAYLATRKHMDSGGKFVWYGFVLYPLCLGLAALSKETGALLPFYVLAIEVCLFRSGREFFAQNRRMAAWLAIFVALPMLAGGLYVATHFAELTDYSNRTFSLSERLLTQVHVVFFYARQILLPRIGAMSLFHDDFPLTSSVDAVTAVLLCLLVAVVGLIWVARKRYPVLAFGLAWFLVSHLLESTFVPLELVYEHRNYLAAAGLLLLPVWAVTTFANVQMARALLVASCLILGMQTWSRVQEWSSEPSMMSVAVHDHPNSARARTMYSNYLYSQDRVQEALEHVAMAMTLQPKDAGPVLHLVMYRCVAGARDAELIDEAEQRLRNYAITTYALNGLENLLALFSREVCTGITLEDLGRLIQATLSLPDNLKSFNYTYLLRFEAMHAFLAGRYAEGVIAYRRAHEASGRITLLAELGGYQISFNRLDDAADTLADIEELNAAAFGVESHVVNRLRDALAKAREPQPAVETAAE